LEGVETRLLEDDVHGPINAVALSRDFTGDGEISQGPLIFGDDTSTPENVHELEFVRCITELFQK
jgi:hypothetical protein